MPNKTLVPHKLVVDFEEDGSLKSGIVMYRVREDGVVGKQFKTLSIKNAGFSTPQFNEILKKIRKHVRKAEKLDDPE